MTSSERQRILLVEDDPQLGQEIHRGLGVAGFDARWVQDGSEAWGLKLEDFDLVVLDLMLPGVHGFDLLAHWREQSDIPVLLLTARNETADKLRAFSLGGDDYLTKPFWPEELVARIHARLRRPVLARNDSLTVGALVLDLRGRSCTVDGEKVELTRVEFDFLSELCRRPGEAMSREILVEKVLGADREGNERTLDVHASRIRKKLKGAASQMETVWGIGYRIRDRR